jgi:hypothetical protein
MGQKEIAIVFVLALEECGFCDVDCHYTFGVFCLYGGAKR